jgi:RNA polymerase sigma-70 factor (sigma-E family)
MTTSNSGRDFDDYVASHGAGLERYACALTGDAHAAQDLVQTALMKAWRRWRRISRVEYPDAYVRRILTNTFIDQRRRRDTGESPIAEVPEWPGGPDPADQAVHRDEVIRALTTLTPTQRAVIVLRHYLGRNDEQIATELGCSVSTVRSHASRGMECMRGYLKYPDLEQNSW